MKTSEPISETRLLLDTFCTITIHGDVDEELLGEAFSLLFELEALLSMTIEGSDIWRINNAAGEPVTVDPRTIEVIRAGLDFSEISNGMFDITVGRLSRLWDFGSGTNFIPSDEEIEEALKSVDYRRVRIDGNTVRLRDGWIDLGAIAKGFIANRVALFLIANGAEGALVNLGGDVVAAGTRNDGNPWRIALKRPSGLQHDIDNEWLGVIEVSWASVSSSGTYERQFEVDGVLYHHILDTRTGLPVETDVVGATLITNSAIIGEGFSTLAVLLGSERAAELFEQVPGFIGAVLILRSGEVQFFGDVEFYGE